MPSDTKYIVNGAQLTDIGAAIRSKLGEQDTYTVDEMPSKIDNISSIHLCTITFINHDSLGQDYEYDNLNTINNGILTHGIIVPYNTSVTAEIIYSFNPWTSDVYICSSSSMGEVTVSNTVNCTVIQGSLIPTDLTKNSSATIEILSTQLPK